MEASGALEALEELESFEEAFGEALEAFEEALESFEEAFGEALVI